MPSPRELKVLSPEVYQTRKDSDSKKIVAFLMTISTSNISSAGTDADVFIEIAGSKFLMDKPGYDDFEKGDTDSYQFQMHMTLGELRKAVIRLYHDNSGSKPGWYCGQVTMQVKFENSNYMRLYKRWDKIGWLAKDEEPYYTTEAVLQEGETL